MPKYVTKAPHKFQHPTLKRAQYAPHQWTRPNYGATKQLATPLDTSTSIPEELKHRIQQIIGTFLYYSCDVYFTMLPSLNTLSEQQPSQTKNTEAAITHFLDYAATNPSVIVQYKARDVILQIDSDASYLSEPMARIRTGGHYYLSSLPTDPKNLQTSCHQQMVQSTRNAESSSMWWRPRTKQKLEECSTMGKQRYP